MKKTIKEQIEEYTKEIEKLLENNKTPKEMINYKKRKIVKLGAKDVKKGIIPFKHGMHLINKKLEAKKKERENKESMGIFKKQKGKYTY